MKASMSVKGRPQRLTPVLGTNRPVPGRSGPNLSEPLTLDHDRLLDVTGVP
jgi:hypothetical protein